MITAYDWLYKYRMLRVYHYIFMDSQFGQLKGIGPDEDVSF
jgi:hypothetical protein